MDKDGAAVQDGQHELYIYKCEDAQKLDNCGYLSLPAYSNDIEGNHDIPGQFSRSHKELVVVKTLLCSTKLTQNGELRLFKMHINTLFHFIIFLRIIFCTFCYLFSKPG